MLTPLASSSRIAPRLARAYAAASSGSAPVAHEAPGDAKLDVIRSTLYPRDSIAPTSASPVGSRHPNHVQRLEYVLPSEEAHETVERAWALLRRRERQARDKALRAKYSAMVDACDELDRLTVEMDNRKLYDRAMARMNHGAAAFYATLQFEGQKRSLKSQWVEARPEGLVPRETWVPTETRGKGWKYDWTRPQCEFDAELG